MTALILTEVARYIEENIDEFHQKRLDKLKTLKFNTLLSRKNPYLFKAKNILTAQDLVKNLLDAYLQSQEETLFGDFLEGVAIVVCQKVFSGRKSTDLVGIDLEFVKDDVYYIVEIKSGPNWGNGSQIKKMRDNFKEARSTLLNRDSTLTIVAVNGCCYGIDESPDKGDYLKICGQAFWTLISGSDTLYTDIIEPIGYKAKDKNDAFMKEYSKVINLFTAKFAKEFCDDGEINWKKIVDFNSKKKIKTKSKRKK